MRVQLFLLSLIHIYTLKPAVVVDGILSKKNLGTKRDDAELVIGVGPGFTAGDDVDVVIETMRGHSLGRCIYCLLYTSTRRCGTF